MQAAGNYEAALTAYDKAMISAQKHKVKNSSISQFIQERILECYSALSDWDGLKLRLASLEVYNSPANVHS